MPLPYFRKPENRTAAEPQGRPDQRHQRQRSHSAGFFPFVSSSCLSLLTLPLFSRPHSLPSVLRVTAINSYEVYFPIPREKWTPLFRFQFQKFQRRTGWPVGSEFHQHSPTDVAWSEDEDEVELAGGGGEKESLVSLTRQRPHASLFLCDHRLFK